MTSFDFNPVHQWAGASTTIRRPREIAYFSFDKHHELKPFSDESLSYYYPPFFTAPHAPRHPVPLSHGFDSFRPRDDGADEHLDGLLDTLAELERRTGERAVSDVVTWRGMMTKILIAPFDLFSEFDMNATCYQGTIFIEENHAHKQHSRASQNNRPPRPGEIPQEMMQYWGYKFETLSVLPRPWAACTRADIEARPHAPTDNHAQFCSIVRTGIGGTSLILAGEVDCLQSCKPADPAQPIPWVELKTAQQPVSDADMTKHERKLLRFWAQSFLLGVPKIVVGYRSPTGHLLQLAELETVQIPNAVARGRRTWDGNGCINAAAAFLAFLQRTVTGEGVWRLRKGLRTGVVEVWRSQAEGTGDVLKSSFKLHREAMLAGELRDALGETGGDCEVLGGELQ